MQLWCKPVYKHAGLMAASGLTYLQHMLAVIDCYVPAVVCLPGHILQSDLGQKSCKKNTTAQSSKDLSRQDLSTGLTISCLLQAKLPEDHSLQLTTLSEDLDQKLGSRQEPSVILGCAHFVL